MSPPFSLNKQQPLRSLSQLLLLVFTGFLLASVISFVVLLFAGQEAVHDLSQASTNTLKLLQSVYVTCIFVLPALFFLRQRLSLEFAPSGNALLPALSLILLFLVMPWIELFQNWNAGLTLPESLKHVENWMKASEAQAMDMTRRFLEFENWTEFISSFIVIAVLAGLAEELLFRACLQPLLIALTRNAHVGILLTSILFSALHMQFFGFLPRFFLGMILGYLYYWNGSLRLPLILHVGNNGLAVLMALWFGPDVLETSLSEQVPWIISFTWALLLPLVLYWMYQLCRAAHRNTYK